MDELPENLKLFAENELIEVLWVYKNYKSFKKVLFTMDKYRIVPVISADDDCIYKYNYAEELYQHWVNNVSSCISYYTTSWLNKHITGGYATLYPPYIFKEFTSILLNRNKLNEILSCLEDDCLYACLRAKVNATQIICLNKRINSVASFHDETTPLHELYKGNKWKQHLTTMWELISSL
jgi:hypothetical protein